MAGEDNGAVAVGNLAVTEGEMAKRRAPAPEALLSIAFRALAPRAIRATMLTMTFTLFSAAVAYPDWKRLAAAGAFAAINVVLWRWER